MLERRQSDKTDYYLVLKAIADDDIQLSLDWNMHVIWEISEGKTDRLVISDQSTTFNPLNDSSGLINIVPGHNLWPSTILKVCIEITSCTNCPIIGKKRPRLS